MGIGAVRDIIADFTTGVDLIEFSAMSFTFDVIGNGQGARVVAIGGFAIGDVDSDGTFDFALRVWQAGGLNQDDFIL